MIIKEKIPSKYKDPFKDTCPNCGAKLQLKRIKKGSFYRRGLRSKVCESCGVAEYDSNPREKAITDGRLDNEL